MQRARRKRRARAAPPESFHFRANARERTRDRAKPAGSSSRRAAHPAVVGASSRESASIPAGALRERSASQRSRRPGQSQPSLRRFPPRGRSARGARRSRRPATPPSATRAARSRRGARQTARLHRSVRENGRTRSTRSARPAGNGAFGGGLPQEALQAPGRCDLPPAGSALRSMGRRVRTDQGRLAVGERLDVQGLQGADAIAQESSPANLSFNTALARKSLFLTVPRGISLTSAISS